MKLSTRSRYGTRLMLKLALNYQKGPISLKDIAQQEEISEKYLSQLVIPLRASGLIYSLRGSQGGYQLSKSPSQISIKDIVQALEGNISPVECVKNPSICSKADDCSVRDIWGNLYKKIHETLDSVSLKDLLESKELKEELVETKTCDK
ncbi:MAG: Rrf2 family transcriptional regulator [Atribacterota bacterium]